jgi:uncharacterized SAM-binding protein YcdF (DUF218 family)
VTGDERRRGGVPAGDAMPEIVLMSDTFGRVDLDDPDPVGADVPPADDDSGTDVSPDTDRMTANGPADPTPMATPVAGAMTGPIAGPIGAPVGAAAATTVLPTEPAVGRVARSEVDDWQVDPAVSAGRRRRRRTWPKVLLALTIVVALAGAYLAVSFWQVRAAGRTDQARPVDAIVVMGAAQYDGTPSPQLAARLDHVVELWGEGLAPVVITTGGNRPGDRFTEAEASAEYLAERGVPSASILQENTGSSTFESLQAVADIAAARGLEEVLIVTDPYHALRSRLIADEVGLTAYVSPTSTSVVTGWSAQRRRLGEAAGVAVGRLIGFERLSGLTS